MKKAHFHKKFRKKYIKLTRKLQEQTDKRIGLFLMSPDDPQVNNHQLKGKYEGYWSINVTGDYRAVYKELNDDEVEFFDVDNHSNLYS